MYRWNVSISSRRRGSYNLWRSLLGVSYQKCVILV